MDHPTRRHVLLTLSVLFELVLGSEQLRPCDIYNASGTPCVAAHSTTRAMYANYHGPLYQIVRTTDKASLNITTLSAGGIANAATQVAFCGVAEVDAGAGASLTWAPGPCCRDFFPEACPDNCDRKSPGACPPNPGCVGCANCGTPSRSPVLATCMITRIFDQSGNGNHVHVIGEPSGTEPVGSGGRLYHGAPTTGTNASADPLLVGGHVVYSAYVEGGQGFRTNTTTKIPVEDEPETLLMVTSGTHYGGPCCFDYGNAEIGTWPNTTNNLTYAKGLMETIYFGEGYGQRGPHVMADLEMGVYDGAHAGGKANVSYAAINATFVTAVVKGDSGNHWSIKWGDAQSGPLHTAFDGPRPSEGTALYNPMKKPGGLVLGLGGDTSNSGVGTFYEGLVVKGYSSDAADADVQANIVAARYAVAA